MENKFPSTGSHRADWLIMLAIVIVLCWSSLSRGNQPTAVASPSRVREAEPNPG
jgi:hypothetical protein